ncbi:methyltransferase domain-containing protein [Anaerosporobacter faecicola]|uniref:methyltransferase domain-containing protein n=1 Tax=Anaerosporobacter faecicola TaxID=2718714 RepID=UPI00143B352B|nr:methyltransferase domain-containing protein [Anaerosporobacter faecicola]
MSTTVFNQLYLDYESEENQSYYGQIGEKLLQYIRKYKDNFEEILDICCGTGIVSQKLREQYGQANIVGLDISQNMLSIAEAKRLENVSFYQYDVNKIETYEQKVDLIICNYGIQWLNLRTIGSIGDTLRKGGIFACTLPGYTIGNVKVEQGASSFIGNMIFKAIIDVSKSKKEYLSLRYPKKIISTWSDCIEASQVIDMAKQNGLELLENKVEKFTIEFKDVKNLVCSILARGTFGNTFADVKETFLYDLIERLEELQCKYQNCCEENISQYLVFQK